MILDDLRVIDTDSPIDTDVCIVGSGPAGWTIAEELRDSALRILMLESGGLDHEPESEALNEVDSVGAPFQNERDRRLGGTSNLWSGRCVALDDIDYEAREWVPLSGWPFASDTVAGYLDRAREYLGAGACEPGGQRPAIKATQTRPDVDPDLLRHVCWEDTEPVNFRRRLMASSNANLRVFLHATVTHLTTDSTGTHIESVEVATSLTKRTTVRARSVVLCAGGVENARIMLYSNRITQSGVGNAHDVVGRYFMDHPRDVELLVRFELRDAARVRQMFGPWRLSRRNVVSYGLALSPKRQRRDALLNCAAWPHEHLAPTDPLEAAKRLVAGPRTEVARDVRHVMSQPFIVVRGLRARLVNQYVRHKIDRIGFRLSSEQVPDRESRICLSERRDRLGLPISQINWRIGQHEKASQAALAKEIESEFGRLGLPRANLPEWVRDGQYEEAALIDGSHPIGATRMANSPRYGVVNSDCQVHGVEGLYVAGSSIFPTAGHANPTLVIVALAVRLSDHLRARFSSWPRLQLAAVNASHTSPHGQRTQARTAQSTNTSVRCENDGLQRSPLTASGPTVRPGTKVVVTGATGFIGGRLVQQLVDQGANVLCLVRRGSRRARPLPPGASARVLDLADADAVSAALDGADLVFHCAYDWDDTSWNLRALRALIDACRVNSCLRLVHLSSFVVYAPGNGEMTEDSALTAAKVGYAHTKLELEAEVMRAVREDVLPATILQPTIVYGPFSLTWTDRPADMLIYGTVILPDSGVGICNAVYVDDVVSAMILAATKREAVGERFLISGPSPISWAQFYEEVATAAGAKGPQYLPAQAIARRAGTVRTILRFATDPIRVMRRVSQTALGAKVMAACLRRLPRGMRGNVQRLLELPWTRRPGYVHVPDVRSHFAVSCAKARHVIGYGPQFDFAAGMVPTAAYLRQYATCVSRPVEKRGADRIAGNDRKT